MGGPNQVSEGATTVLLSEVAPDRVRWYAIQTRARHEKTVAVQLEEKGITTFLPLLTQVHRWSDRRKVVQVPMFSCYTFVHLSASGQERLRVLRTPGVVAFVGTQGQGIPIPDKQIENIQTVLAHHVACEPYPFLRKGQRVRIRGGCLDGIEGIIVAKNSNRNLVVSVDLIRQSLAIQI